VIDVSAQKQSLQQSVTPPLPETADLAMWPVGDLTPRAMTNYKGWTSRAHKYPWRGRCKPLAGYLTADLSLSTMLPAGRAASRPCLWEPVHDGPRGSPRPRAGFHNSTTVLDLGFYAVRSYSLMRPPRTGRRLIRSWERSAGG
jgi:hypothetical protein